MKISENGRGEMDEGHDLCLKANMPRSGVDKYVTLHLHSCSTRLLSEQEFHINNEPERTLNTA